MKPIRIVLADDHTLVRAGIRNLLQNMNNIEVIAEADNGRETLKIVEETKPDMVLLDIAMPELNGLEVAARLSKEYPDIDVMILSMHANEEYVVQALKAGASGYLLKDSAPSELDIAVHAVARGETYLSPAISKHVVHDYLRRVNNLDLETEEEPNMYTKLTPRQREILQLIAEGNSTKVIAGKLNVSVKTVETHRIQLMNRVAIHDVAGLVRYAIRTGMVSSER